MIPIKYALVARLTMIKNKYQFLVKLPKITLEVNKIVCQLWFRIVLKC